MKHTIAQWQIDSNIATHGIQWTAKWLRRKGIKFENAYTMLFGRAPRLTRTEEEYRRN